eukprot:snap_masked-scaffold_12-processed-gene-3.20-mRNA-1 protein AED:0.52 eAED:0.54 QI:0/0/0/1/1/1/2/0/280
MKEKKLSLLKGFQIKNKVCVVTGGGSGIGEAYCEEFCAHNAKVVIVADTNSLNGKIVAKSLRKKYSKTKVVFQYCNLADKAQLKILIDETIQRFGGLDLFAITSGVLHPSIGLQNWDEEQYNGILEANTQHIVNLSNNLTPYFLKQKSGCFLITVSAAGLPFVLDKINCTASKTAAVAIAEFLSVQYGHRGINTVCFCPKVIQKSMPYEAYREAAEKLSVKAVARKVMDAIEEEAEDLYVNRGAGSNKKWILGTQKFRENLTKKCGRWDKSVFSLVMGKI